MLEKAEMKGPNTNARYFHALKNIEHGKRLWTPRVTVVDGKGAPVQEEECGPGAVDMRWNAVTFCVYLETNWLTPAILFSWTVTA